MNPSREKKWNRVISDDEHLHFVAEQDTRYKIGKIHQQKYIGPIVESCKRMIEANHNPSVFDGEEYLKLADAEKLMQDLLVKEDGLRAKSRRAVSGILGVAVDALPNENVGQGRCVFSPECADGIPAFGPLADEIKTYLGIMGGYCNIFRVHFQEIKEDLPGFVEKEAEGTSFIKETDFLRQLERYEFEDIEEEWLERSIPSMPASSNVLAEQPN